MGKNRNFPYTWFIAIPLGICAYVIFLSFFMFMQASPVSQTDIFKDRVFFVDLSKTRNFARMLEYAAPTTLPKPNYQYGFSSILSRKNSQKTVDEFSQNNSPRLKFRVDLPKFLDTVSFNTSEDIASRLEEIWKSVLPSRQFSESTTPSLPSFPVCATPEGSILNLNLKVFGIEEIIGNAPPKHLTEIRLKFMDEYFPRYEIISSSGNKELDIAAAKALCAQHKTIRNQLDISPNDCISLLIHWKKGISTCSK